MHPLHSSPHQLQGFHARAGQNAGAHCRHRAEIRELPGHGPDHVAGHQQIVHHRRAHGVAGHGPVPQARRQHRSLRQHSPQLLRQTPDAPVKKVLLPAEIRPQVHGDISAHRLPQRLGPDVAVDPDVCYGIAFPPILLAADPGNRVLPGRLCSGPDGFQRQVRSCHAHIYGHRPPENTKYCGYSPVSPGEKKLYEKLQINFKKCLQFSGKGDKILSCLGI